MPGIQGACERAGDHPRGDPAQIAFVDRHGGDLNGFFLIRGESAKLDGLIASEEWITHAIRALVHLDKAGVVRGAGGDLVQERMASWLKEIPAK